METIGTRIKRLRLEMSPKLTQKELAARLGIKPPSVFLWETDNTKPSGENLLALAHILKTTPEAILGIKTYATPKTAPKYGVSESGQIHITTAEGLHHVPVITNAQAAEWKTQTTHNLTNHQRWQATTVPVSANAYAITAEGKAMHNPNGAPSIPSGSTVVVDPDVTARSGNIVVIKHLDTGHITIKKLAQDGGDYYLEPLNPDYKPSKLDNTCEIIGVCRQVAQDI